MMKIPTPEGSDCDLEKELTVRVVLYKICTNLHLKTSSRGGCRHSSWILVLLLVQCTALCPEEWSSTGNINPVFQQLLMYMASRGRPTSPYTEMRCDLRDFLQDKHCTAKLQCHFQHHCSTDCNLPPLPP